MLQLSYQVRYLHTKFSSFVLNEIMDLISPKIIVHLLSLNNRSKGTDSLLLYLISLKTAISTINVTINNIINDII